MEEDTEVLDWGHEEDEQLTAHFQQRASDGRDSWRDQEDAEDAVSLGGDEDDMQNFYNHRSTEPDASKGQPSTPKMSFSQQQHSHQSKRDYQREPSGNSQKQQPPLQSQNPGSPQLRRSQSHGKMTHALPPKPVVSVAPVHPSPAQTSTLASSMVQRERRVNGHGKPVSSSDGIDVLPPDWEVRYPRSGGSDHYYYNLKTHESTWTQPGLVSGRSSPLKDRESGTIQTVGGRSPNQISHDATVRADSTERHVLPSSDHKDLKHKTSPAGQLSYEDRHYRPGGSSHASASVEPSDRREDRGSSTQSPYPEGSYHPSRVPTPRNMSERRRTRSISPRRDSQTHDRFVRVRREMTPPRSAVDHGTWREPHRDIPATRQSNVPDHAWSSSRNALPEEPMPGQVHENRPRGRPPRVGVEPSTHSAPKGPKVHASDQWSPTRHRSPPHFREPSPPLRRPPQGPVSGLSQPSVTISAPVVQRHKSRFDQPANPPVPPSTRGILREHDVYKPPDSVPQRRGRDFDLSNSGPEYPEYEVKRRRVDELITDQPPTHRASPATVPNLPERPHSSTFSSPASQNDQSRLRKRPPLPPQSTRFREAATTQPSALESLLVSPPVSGPGSDGSPNFTPHQRHDRSLPPNTTDHPNEAAPARHQLPPVHDIEFDGDQRATLSRPAATLGRSGSRFDNPPQLSARDFPTSMERVGMEIDETPYRLSTLRIHERPARANAGMYADRLGADVQTDVPPRGPRAMASRSTTNPMYPPPPPSPLISHTASYSNARPTQLHEMTSGAGGLRSRPSQSELTGGEGWRERRDRSDAPPRFPKGPIVNQEYTSRRFDDVKYRGPTDMGNRQMEEAPEPVHQDMRGPRESLTHYNHSATDDPPAPPLPVSGTNSVPIGNRRGPSDLGPELPRSRSPVQQYRPSTGGGGGSLRGRSGHGNIGIQDEHDRMGQNYPAVSSSPAQYYRPPPPDIGNSMRRGSLSSSSHNEGLTSERPPSQVVDVFPGSLTSSRPRRNSFYSNQRERPARQSRFGPEPSQPPAPAQSEPRIWMTREESLENRAREAYQMEGPHRLPNSRPTRAETISWQPPVYSEPSGAAHRYSNSAGQGSRHDTNLQSSAIKDSLPQQRHQDFVADRRKDHSGTVDAHPRVPPPSLEGRLSSRYDDQYNNERYRSADALSSSLPARPHDRDTHAESQPRPEFRETRDYPPFREAARASWDRPEAPVSTARPHADRAQLVEPSIGQPAVPQEDVSMRTSKPVRIRRPPPLSAKPSQEGFAAPSGERDDSQKGGRDDGQGADLVEIPAHQDVHQRPTMARRAGSLLDRLSLDNPAPGLMDASSPSLRERVEASTTGDVEDTGGVHSDMSMEVEYDGGWNMGMDSGLRGMRGGYGKRRFIKPKRGRRGGAP
ncbi:hypothetical protein AcW1_001884 [Taiwanofungus camphoratus]|nr:hypothetical protein AcW1_001884 [Antrodia cinnamomea]